MEGEWVWEGGVVEAVHITEDLEEGGEGAGERSVLTFNRFCLSFSL